MLNILFYQTILCSFLNVFDDSVVILMSLFWTSSILGYHHHHHLVGWAGGKGYYCWIQ
jgi:hypothetical protein